MDNESQAQLARGGRPSGVRNYQNNVLIDIVERLLPQGLEGWREVDATITLPDAATLLPRCRHRPRFHLRRRRAAAKLPPPPPSPLFLSLSLLLSLSPFPTPLLLTPLVDC